MASGLDEGNPPLLVVCDMDRLEVHTNHRFSTIEIVLICPYWMLHIYVIRQLVIIESSNLSDGLQHITLVLTVYFQRTDCRRKRPAPSRK